MESFGRLKPTSSDISHKQTFFCQIAYLCMPIFGYRVKTPEHMFHRKLAGTEYFQHVGPPNNPWFLIRRQTHSPNMDKHG